MPIRTDVAARLPMSTPRPVDRHKRGYAPKPHRHQHLCPQPRVESVPSNIMQTCNMVHAHLSQVGIATPMRCAINCSSCGRSVRPPAHPVNPIDVTIPLAMIRMQ